MTGVAKWAGDGRGGEKFRAEMSERPAVVRHLFCKRINQTKFNKGTNRQ
jgi:hypothetical protein